MAKQGAAAIIEIQKAVRFALELSRSFEGTAPELPKQLNRLLLEIELILQIVRKEESSPDFLVEDVQSLKAFIQDAAAHLLDIESSLRKELQKSSHGGGQQYGNGFRQKVTHLLFRLGSVDPHLTFVRGLIDALQIDDQANRCVFGTNCPYLIAGKPAQGSHLLTTQQTSAGGCQWASTPGIEESHSEERHQHHGQMTRDLWGHIHPVNESNISQDDGPEASGAYSASSRLAQLRERSCLLQRVLNSRSKSRRYFVHTEAPILVHARDGNEQAIRCILQRDPASKWSMAFDGRTPMSVAIEHGRRPIVKLLLDAGVDVNEKFGRFNNTALSEALRCRRLDIAELLIQSGADFSARNSLGRTPIFNLWNLERNAPAGEFIRLLAESKSFNLLHRQVFDTDGWSVMHRAASFGCQNDVELLEQLGVDSFTRVQQTEYHTEHEGWTALHLAAWYGAVDTVRPLARLHAKGPGIDVGDNDGNTALHFAIIREHLDIVTVLFQEGASLRQPARVSWIGEKHRHGDNGHNAFSLAEDIGPDFLTQFTERVANAFNLAEDIGPDFLTQIKERVAKGTPVGPRDDMWAAARERMHVGATENMPLPSSFRAPAPRATPQTAAVIEAKINPADALQGGVHRGHNVGDAAISGGDNQFGDRWYLQLPKAADGDKNRRSHKEKTPSKPRPKCPIRGKHLQWGALVFVGVLVLRSLER